MTPGQAPADPRQLEARLIAAAERAPELPPNFAATVRIHARRRTRIRGGVTLGAAAAVTATVVAVPALRPVGDSSSRGVVAGAPAVAQWPARGPLVGEPGLTDEVRTAWTSAEGAAVSDVALLYAGPVAGTRFVVARGTSTDGRMKVGFLSSAAPGKAADADYASAGRLWLRGSITPTPDSAVLSIATSHLGDGLGATTPGLGAVVAFALGAPGTKDLTFQSSTIDDQMVENAGHRNASVGWFPLFSNSLAVTDTVTRWDANGRKTTTPVDTAGLGDPTVTTAVQPAGSGHVTLDVGSSNGVQQGDLVLAPAGLLGTVDAVATETSSVLLVTDPNFKTRAVSDITKVPGRIEHVGHQLQFVADDASSRPSLNRIMTDTTPTVTIGFAGGGTSSPVVSLTPAVTGDLPTTATVLLLHAAS